MACISDLRLKSVFYRVSNGKYRLRRNLSLHFYSSEAPSGDAIENIDKFTPCSLERVVNHASFDFLHPNKGALSVKLSSSML